ncbi:hypothetical protein [Colwellia sp. C1TZA3]|uniref:hypothetical protein n=1 Tax=Colwellia sp. C1TZA3 TaxID=2508879 RepID=UPI0011B9F53D|nr:hypothetical protein [Colwellia sp. C1TZA3]TWX72213.1 hypothetical protein ESZ39_08955 [Colwellia sp. C1TZA3]
MLNKLISLFIRCLITFGVGWGVGAGFYEYSIYNDFDSREITKIAQLAMFIIWGLGCVYSLLKFHHFFKMLEVK